MNRKQLGLIGTLLTTSVLTFSHSQLSYAKNSGLKNPPRIKIEGLTLTKPEIEEMTILKKYGYDKLSIEEKLNLMELYSDRQSLESDRDKFKCYFERCFRELSVRYDENESKSHLKILINPQKLNVNHGIYIGGGAMLALLCGLSWYSRKK